MWCSDSNAQMCINKSQICTFEKSNFALFATTLEHTLLPDEEEFHSHISTANKFKSPKDSFMAQLQMVAWVRALTASNTM